MKQIRLFFHTAGVALAGVMFVGAAWGEAPTAVQRGEYIFQATGGCACHTDVKNDGAFLAGGRAMATPFGKVYATNITPDVKTGIGDWSDEAFIRAMTQGVGPHGEYYLPVFPYTAFTKMTRSDLLDLKAYLFSVPPVVQANQPHDLPLPLRWRFLMRGWQWLFFRPGEFEPDPSQSEEWNRGAYIVTALAHCGECHTPRNLVGALKPSMAYAGAEEGPEGELAPNITPDEATGIGSWSLEDIVWFLQMGLKPDGDDTQGLMSEVIETGYQHLREADLRAIAVYLKTLKPISNRLLKKD
jgi:mono/diheme cytochrome c family protein